MEKDVLLELSNVSMGSAATALSNMLNRVVRLSPPEITETTTAVWQERHNRSGILIRIAFKNGLEGVNYLFLAEREAASLAGLLLGEDVSPSQAVDFPELGAINESMGIIMGSYTNSLASFLGLTLELDPPEVEQINPVDKDFVNLGFTGTDPWVELNFSLEIEPDQTISLIQLFPFPFLKTILTLLMQGLGIDLPEQESPAQEASQAELEELLSQTEDSEDTLTSQNVFVPGLDEYLNDMEKDTIAEVSNISLGSSATALSQLVDQRVQITTPQVSLTTMEKLREEYPYPSVIAKVNYREGLEGESILILQEEDAALIAGLMMGLPPEDVPKKVGEMEMSAVSEAMNQMMGSAATAMSDFLARKVDISPPNLNHANLQEEMVQVNQIEQEEPVLQISFQLDIGDLLQSRLIQVIPFPFAKKITSFLLKDMMIGEEETENKDLPVSLDSPPSSGGELSGEILSEIQKDALAEVGNISLGSSATALSELINKKVNITAPRVTLTTMKEVSANYPVPCLVVMVNYIKGLDGNNVLIIKKEDALVIVGLMMGMEPPERPQELDELEISAVSEAMNQMMGSAATAMSDLLERLIDISPPEIVYKDLNGENLNIDIYDEDALLVQVAFRMEVEGLLDSDLLQLIPLNFAGKITSHLLSAFTGEDGYVFPEPVQSAEESALDEPTVEISGSPPGLPRNEGEELLFSGIEEEEAFVSSPRETIKQLTDDEYAKLNLIRDIPLEIQAVLGKTRVPLKRIFSLLPGEIVSLNRFLGEPVDLFANQRLVATGEVVLVNGQFGVKITEIIRPKY